MNTPNDNGNDGTDALTELLLRTTSERLIFRMLDEAMAAGPGFDPEAKYPAGSEAEERLMIEVFSDVAAELGCDTKDAQRAYTRALAREDQHNAAQRDGGAS